MADNLIAVPPQNTSCCCPACGHAAKDNRQTQAKFECVKCGYQNHADVVGAINALKRNQEILVAQEKLNQSRVCPQHL